MESLRMNKDTAMRVLKYTILATWSLGVISTYHLVEVIISLLGVCASGYDYGDHPVDEWDFTGPVWTAMVIGVVLSLALACVGILAIAVFLSLFQDQPIRSTFKKVYKALLFATWPLILIASLINLICFILIPKIM